MEVLQPYCRAIPSFSLEPYSGGSKFKNGDTIMARITPCLENGKTVMVNILDKNEIGFGSTEYIVFRAKENITDPFFIYYLVTSDKIRNPAIKSMVGSSGRQRVQTDVVANLSINLPPLETQKKIAALLSSLDDKIEFNNRINDNLEQQAQAIYDELCKDANINTLEKLISTIETGSRPKGGAETSGIPSIGAEKIEALGKYDYSSEKYISIDYFAKMKRGIVFSKDVLLYKDGAYTGKSSMALNGFPHEKCAVNEHVFILRTKNTMLN
ncbi:restriction endonuclease subunit S, partial [Treponema sp. JC4]|uniref:restriction endonuclease subunit S n=1 Tax=Treponema sp. JC4 TaxID=1124982 RepID=UPI00192A6EBA